MVLVGALFFAVALLLAGNARAVGRVISGAMLFLLGYASVAPDLAVLDTLPMTFLAVSAGFIWLGLGLVLWGVQGGIERSGELVIARLGALTRPAVVSVTLVALLPLLYIVQGTLAAASWRGLLAAIGLGGAGLLLVALLSLVRSVRGWRWLDDRWLTHWSEGTPALLPVRTRLKGATAFLLLVFALLIPHLAVASLATILGCFLLHDALRPSGKVPRWGLQPFIVLVALVAATWFVWTIAGSDIPLTLDGLREAPFSAAAEMMLAPMLGLAAWALLGLWPLHGSGPASALSFVGGALLIRWGMGMIPTGMEHIAPLAGIAAVIASFHASSRRRSGEYAAALGVLAVVPSGVAAWPFFVLGSLPATLWVVGRKSGIPGIDRHQSVGLGLLPALAWALPTMLRGETVLTVVALLAGVALFLPVEADVVPTA